MYCLGVKLFLRPCFRIALGELVIRKALLLCMLLKSQTTAIVSGTACNVPELFAAFEGLGFVYICMFSPMFYCLLSGID